MWIGHAMPPFGFKIFLEIMKHMPCVHHTLRFRYSKQTQFTSQIEVDAHIIVTTKVLKLANMTLLISCEGFCGPGVDPRIFWEL